MISWHYFAAGALAVLARAGFSQIGHMRHANIDAVVINAHEHTDAVHRAVAALDIPGLLILDANKSPAPTFVMQLFSSAASAAIFLVLFLLFLWLLRRIWPRIAADLTRRSSEPPTGEKIST
jgi:hypothetical protein